jgi:hypothetical protein
MGSCQSKEQLISKKDDRFIKKCLEKNKMTKYEAICLLLNMQFVMIREEKTKKHCLKTVCDKVNYRVVSSFEMVYHSNMLTNIFNNKTSNHLTSLFFKISNPSPKFQVIEFQTPMTQFIKNFVYKPIDLKLEFNEDYAARKDSSSIYRIYIFLYDEYFNKIDSFTFIDKLGSRIDLKWQSAKNVFKITKPFKYIFIHRGKELPFIQKLQFTECQVKNRIIRFIIY